MKGTCLSILLLATSATAYKNGVKQKGNGVKGEKQGNNRGLKKGARGLGMSKLAQGMKSKKGKGCQSVKFKGIYSEIYAGISQTAVGETLTFPVYDYDTDEPIGTYTDQTTQISVEGEDVDCTFSGSFNFDFDDSLVNPFASQLMVSGTCQGAYNAITGGTGKYACASGTEIFIDVEADYFASELVICNTCA
jgi:hypothetical protein